MGGNGDQEYGGNTTGNATINARTAQRLNRASNAGNNRGRNEGNQFLNVRAHQSHGDSPKESDSSSSPVSGDRASDAGTVDTNPSPPSASSEQDATVRSGSISPRNARLKSRLMKAMDASS